MANSLFDKLTDKYDFNVGQEKQATYTPKPNDLFNKLSNKYNYNLPKPQETQSFESDEDFFNRLRNNNTKVDYSFNQPSKKVNPYSNAVNEKGEPVDYDFQLKKLKGLREQGKALFKDKTDAELEAKARQIYEIDKKRADTLDRAKKNEGDTSYKAYLDTNGLEDKLSAKIGYALDTPYRIKGISNIFSTVAENMGAGDSLSIRTNEAQRKTGNSIIDGATGLLGQGASMLTAVPGTNVNPINVADDFAGNIANKATSKLGAGATKNIANSMVKGAVSGAIDNTIDNVKLAGQDEGLGESLLNGALGGGLLFGAGRGLKEGGNKISSMIDDSIDKGFGASNLDFNKKLGLDIKSPKDMKVLPKEKPILETKIDTPKVEVPKVEKAVDTEIPKITNNKKNYFLNNGDILFNDRTPKIVTRRERLPDLGGEIFGTKPLAERTINDVRGTPGKKVPALQIEYPELKPNIQEAAQQVLGEIGLGVKGGKSQNIWDDGKFAGRVNQKREQSDIIVDIINETGGVYKNVEKALNDIIEDHGKENNANAKKVEALLDEALLKGRETVDGRVIPPDKDYISKKSMIIDLEQGKKYHNETVYTSDMTPKFKIKNGLNRENLTNVNVGPDKIAGELLDSNKPTLDTGNYEQYNFGNEAPDGVIALEKDTGRVDGVRQPKIETTPTNDDFEINYKESKQKTNTWRNADFMQNKEAQKMVNEVNAFYEVKPNAQSFEIAQNELTNNYDEVINRIKTQGIKTAEDSVASGIITNDLVRQAKETGDYSKVKEWLGIVRPQITDIAQSLQAFSTWKDMTPEGALLKAQRVVDSAKDKMLENKRLRKKLEEEIAKNPQLESEILDKFKVPKLTDEDTKFIVDTMEKIQGMPEGRAKDIEFAKIKQLMADKAIPTFGDKFKAAQRIAMLLNTKTMTRNIVGNVVMGGLENTKDLVGTGIDKVISKTTGKRTTSIPSISTQIKAGLEGFKNTLEDHKLGIDTSRSQGQYELPNTKSFKSGPLSKLEDLTSTGLKLGDNPFYEAAYNDTIRQLQDLQGTKEITKEMMELADKVAKDRTFQNSSGISHGLKEIQRGLNLGKDTGLGTIALPFVKTPANILDKAIDYSPAGIGKGLYGLYKNGGDLTLAQQKKIVDQLSRGITGTGLIGAGYLGAESGLLTGSGPDDREAADLEAQAGKLPYSVKVGDTYNTIDNLQPAAIPLMIGADINKALKDNKSKGGAIETGIKTGVGTLFNQSLLTGLSKLFGGYEKTPGENIVSGGINTAAQIPGQLFPSALKQVAQLIDTTQRDTSSDSILEREFNKIKAKTPFVSKSLPARIDTMGREKANFGGKDGINYLYDVLFNPGMSDKYEPNKAEKLALDIYNETGDTVQMPRYAKNSITYKSPSGKKETLQLTNAEKMELQKFIGEKTNNAYSSMSMSNSPEEQAKKLQSLLTEIYKDGENMILSKKGLPRK